MDETSRKLVAPRTGSQILTRLDQQPQRDQQVCIAAWQTTEAKAPKRCVVRVDGTLRNELDEDGSPGFPCAMVSVQYAIGGLSKKVLIDAIGQSALVVWAESIEVLAMWDERRVTRIATAGLQPCQSQLVAASINSEANVGDTGPADARWLDMLAVDATDTGVEWSINPIPDGARGVRFLNALASGANVVTASVASLIIFSALQFSRFPSGIVETAVNGFTDQSFILIPAGARFLFVKFPTGTIASFDEPAWLEWDMSPNSLFGG